MIGMILENVKRFEATIAWLKENSPYWPQIMYKNREDSTIYASTLVRIEREGKWYAIHCV